MGKHYHLRFDPNLGHGICAIFRITCACVGCTSIMYQPWISGVQSTKYARYQSVINCSYWPVMDPYNNCSIIHLTPKSIPSEAFDEIHQVVIDGISENIASLVQSGMYGAINKYDTTKKWILCHSLHLICIKLQNSTTIDGQVISCQGTIALLHAIKHQLVLETKTTSTDHYSTKTHSTSSTS